MSELLRVVIRDFDRLVKKIGRTVSIYQPTISYNEERDKTYDLGEATTTKAIITDLTPDQPEVIRAGLDVSTAYNCYLKATETITKDTIIKIGDLYYTIWKIQKNEIAGSTAFYSLIIQQEDIKTA
ncbi:MAG: hypothetical protein DRP11_00125 [Candidatus Aenigmatarchaeota archaeon]|nr:MAG: hypothetical protein DRP11_00125 [Candidatus Aenigmarchaeota archaeon]